MKFKSFLTGLGVLAVSGMVLAGDMVVSENPQTAWKGSVFGDVGGQDHILAKNFSIHEDTDGFVNMRVSNNKGKIASSTDGILFYYQELEPSSDFTMTAIMAINDFDENNQVSFGLMARDEILVDTHDSAMGTDYVAAGAIRLKDDIVKHTITRIEGKHSRMGDHSYKPMEGDEIRVNLEKSGNQFTTWVEGDEPVVTEVGFAGDTMYIGMYAVRNADVTFMDIELEVE